MSIKYEKTKEDEKIEKRDLEQNRTLKHLRDLNFYKFSVGDVLIREERRGDKWVTETAQNGLPNKYIYAFENSLGVGYIRRFAIDGSKFVESPICVVNFDPEETRFQLDPGYADHLMMGEGEYDIKAAYKALDAKRKAMHRMNDSILEKTDTIADAIAFIRKLNPGDKVWYGFTRNSVGKEPYIVKSVLIVPHLLEQSTVTVTPSWYQSGRSYVEPVSRMTRQRWHTTRPQFLDEAL